MMRSVQRHASRHSRQADWPGAAGPATPVMPVLVALDAAAAHSKPKHPEGPQRLAAVQSALQQSRLESSRAVRILHPVRSATDAELEAVHPLRYIQRLREICGSIQGPTLIDDSTYIAPGSMQAVTRGVGAVFDVLDALLTPAAAAGAASVSAGFALVRPPGHHVLPTRPMGFGLVNTVALAARYAQQRHGVRRIMIFDFDVHHGNGTMDVFYNNPDVLYVSTHQDGLWPYTGKLRNIGQGAGQGTTINIPLPGLSGDAAMRHAWERVVVPAAARFQPDLILVSAGYDAHFMDPLGSMQLTTAGYGWLGSQLSQLSQQLCGGRLVCVLEGGYHCESLGASVIATLQGMAYSPMSLSDLECDQVSGEDVIKWLQPEPLGKVEAVLDQVVRLHGL